MTPTFTVERNKVNAYKINVEIVLDADDHGLGFPCDADDATKLLHFALHHDCGLDVWAELDIARKALEAVKKGREATQFAAQPEGGNEPDPEL